MKKHNYTRYAALLVLLLSTLSQINVQAQRLGLHVTQEEIAIWKQRAASGPYKTKGDVSTNSADDWARITRNANALLSNPSTEFFVGYTGTGCVPKWSIEPQNKAEKIRDAGFAFLITGNTNYRNAVRAALLKQAAEPSTDFSNKSKWCPNFLKDINPGFFYATWMTRMFFGYDYIKHTLSATDKQILDNWFYNAAKYFQHNVDADLNRPFVDRMNGNYTIASGMSHLGNTNHVTHYNGYKIPNLALWYNNRRSAQISFATLVGIHINDASLKKSGKLFVKEAIMFATFADGTMGEFERWSDGAPEMGWQYTMILADHCMNIADHLARAGDRELYDFTTSTGKFGTEGGSKSLRTIFTNMLKYTNRSHNRYATAYASRVGNNNYRIDGISPLNGFHYVFDIWVSQANVYYKDEFLKSVYMRRASGTSPYPSNPTGSGSNNAWTGGFGIYPGKLFMFGQMEGRVNPYPGTTTVTAPVEPTPVDPTPVEYKGSGSITRDFWSNVTGTTVSTIPLTRTPTSTSSLTIFEGRTNAGDNYASRIRGYIHPPVSGNYTFWIAGDDNCELWLSTDESLANKRKIASVSGWTNPREYTKFSTQKSVTISLVAGKKYYIEALHKEGVGGDNLSVGWALPNGTLERPIAGMRLSPYVAISAARIESAEAVNTTSVEAFPNPFTDVVNVKVGQHSGEVALSIADTRGSQIYKNIVTISGNESAVSINLTNQNLAKGIYFLTVSFENGSKETVKLIKY